MSDNKIDKFKHLDNYDPNANNILKIPIGFIKNEHLGTLRDNLNSYSEHKNPEIANAALKIIGNINEILSLGNKKISSEIVKATSDDYSDS